MDMTEAVLKSFGGDSPGGDGAGGGPRVAEPVIEVRDLRMRYGAKEVLDGIGFSARPGEVIALLGPNGAGKTTTIEILEGFRRRSAGHVRVLGVDPEHGNERWRARLRGVPPFLRGPRKGRGGG